MNDDTREYVDTLTDIECIEALEDIHAYEPTGMFEDEDLIVKKLHEIEAEIYHRFTSRPGTLIRKTRNKE